VLGRVGHRVDRIQGGLGSGRQNEDLVHQDDAQDLGAEHHGREGLVQWLLGERLLSDRRQ